MRAVRVHEFGGPEMMTLDDLPEPQPGQGQLRVRIEAAGVNFIDVYQRTGAYKNALPYGLGLEGAGVVESVGGYLIDPALTIAINFALFMLILLVRPTGLFTRA